jgi:hypothetical protein
MISSVIGGCGVAIVSGLVMYKLGMKRRRVAPSKTQMDRQLTTTFLIENDSPQMPRTRPGTSVSIQFGGDGFDGQNQTIQITRTASRGGFTRQDPVLVVNL